LVILELVALDALHITAHVDVEVPIGTCVRRLDIATLEVHATAGCDMLLVCNRPDLAADERFKTNLLRAANRDALAPEIDRELAAIRAAHERPADAD